MNAQKVRRPAWRTRQVETQDPAPYSRTASTPDDKVRSRAAYEMPAYPGRPGKHLPLLRLSPADDPEPVEGKGSRHEARWSRQSATGRILIVEDDADLRETLADILQYEGYRVETAGNGQEGWARLSAEPRPALVLLDLMMPVVDGWEFRARQLRDPQLAGIPVVLISAAEGIRQQAALLSADSFLAKPIDVSRLIEMVNRFLD